MSLFKYPNITETVTEIVTKTVYVPVYRTEVYPGEHFPAIFNSSILASTKVLADLLNENQVENYWYPTNTAEPGVPYGLDGILHIGHHDVSTTQERDGALSFATGHYLTVTAGSDKSREEIRVGEMVQQEAEEGLGEMDGAHLWAQLGLETDGHREAGWPGEGVGEQEELEAEQNELEQNEGEETSSSYTGWLSGNGQKKGPPSPAEREREEQEEVPTDTTATSTQLNDTFLTTSAPAPNDSHPISSESSQRVNATVPNTHPPISETLEHYSLQRVPKITRKTFNGVVAHNWPYASTLKGESPSFRYLPVYATLLFTIAAIPLLL